MMSTADRARNQWPEILPLLGVEARFLTGRHGPCPMCGGKDRFRFTDKDGDGWYYCNQCGPGSGLLLLRRLHGWDRGSLSSGRRVLGTEKGAHPERASRTDAAKLAAIHKRSRGHAPNRHQLPPIARHRRVVVGAPATACSYFGEDHHRRGFPAVVARSWHPTASSSARTASTLPTWNLARRTPR